MVKQTQKKKRYIDIEQVDQECINMSINLKDEQELDFS